MQSFSDSNAIFLYPDVSDHSPGLVKLGGQISRRKHIFKFFNMWIKDEQFESIVRNARNIRVSGTPMFVLTHKLKATIRRHLSISIEANTK